MAGAAVRACAADLRYQLGIYLAATERQKPADDARKRSSFAPAGSAGPDPARSGADMLPDWRRMRPGGGLHRTITLPRWLCGRWAAGAGRAGRDDLARTNLSRRCAE